MVFKICGLHGFLETTYRLFFVATTCIGSNLQNIIFITEQKLAYISIDVVLVISNLGSNALQFNISPKPFTLMLEEMLVLFNPFHILTSN